MKNIFYSATDLAGRFAESGAGHDKGEIFIILKNNAVFADIADGKKRLAGKPKRKNLKHLKIRNEAADKIRLKLKNNEAVSNEEIKYAIKSLLTK